MGNPDILKTVCPKCGHIGGIHKEAIRTAKCYICKTHPVVTTKNEQHYDLMTTDERKHWDAHLREKHTLSSNVFDKELYEKSLDNDFDRNLEIEIQKREKEFNNQIKCPACNSTQIQLVNRKWTPFMGIFTNKVDRVCMNCKKKF